MPLINDMSYSAHSQATTKAMPQTLAQSTVSHVVVRPVTESQAIAVRFLSNNVLKLVLRLRLESLDR